MIELDGRLEKIFPDPPLLCNSRPKNLKDELIRARLPPKERRSKRRKLDGFYKCREFGCRLCPYIDSNSVIKEVIVSNTGEVIPIKGVITCKSTNVIYEAHCNKCSTRAQYVGTTGKAAEERWVGHRATITQHCHENTTTPVGSHFRQQGHSVTDISFIPFEKCYGDAQIRLARESMYIQKFKTMEKPGLNLKL